MRYHDFHLRGYEVQNFGTEIVLHLVYDYPPTPPEESHIRFADVEVYHFIHSGGSIIVGIEEVLVSDILDQFWDKILHWACQHGGIPHWDRDDRASYQAKLIADGYKAWDISSAIGFSGFVIAKSIADVSHDNHPAA
jgi:hypothetical protein